MPLSPVYTTRFIGTQGLTGEIGYTVPAGFVAVCVHADTYVDNATLQESQLFLKSLTDGWSFSSWIATPPTKFLGRWDGRVAFHEGEQFGFSTDGVIGWDVQVTGYLLTLSP